MIILGMMILGMMILGYDDLEAITPPKTTKAGPDRGRVAAGSSTFKISHF